MRADVSDLLKVGDFVTLSDGLYAGLDGEVIEVVHTIVPWVGRARLKLPEPHGESWHPFWSDPMDESEWLTTKNTSAMERFLISQTELTDRRWYLYACACIRRVWDLLPQEHQEAVAFVEEDVDSRTARPTPNYPLSCRLPGGKQPTVRPESAMRAVLYLFPYRAQGTPVSLAEMRRLLWLASANVNEPDIQRELLRDIFGNPYRPISLSRDLLNWNQRLIPALARQIYDERRFEEMSILADALEDAGCCEESVLAHARSPYHARGCWLLDAILG